MGEVVVGVWVTVVVLETVQVSVSVIESRFITVPKCVIKYLHWTTLSNLPVIVTVVVSVFCDAVTKAVMVDGQVSVV